MWDERRCLTRNQVYRKVPWVRIPPSLPVVDSGLRVACAGPFFALFFRARGASGEPQGGSAVRLFAQNKKSSEVQLPSLDFFILWDVLLRWTF